MSVKNLEHGYIQDAIYRPTYQGTDCIACIWLLEQLNKHTFIAENRFCMGVKGPPSGTIARLEDVALARELMKPFARKVNEPGVRIFALREERGGPAVAPRYAKVARDCPSARADCGSVGS